MYKQVEAIENAPLSTRNQSERRLTRQRHAAWARDEQQQQVDEHTRHLRAAAVLETATREQNRHAAAVAWQTGWAEREQHWQAQDTMRAQEEDADARRRAVERDQARVVAAARREELMQARREEDAEEARCERGVFFLSLFQIGLRIHQMFTYYH